MTSPSLPPATLCLGADAGGTKVELLAQTADAAPPRAFFGSACNLQRQGLAATADTLASLVEEAAAAFPGVERVAVCAGVAGAGQEDDRTALADALVARLSRLRLALDLTHDADIALEGAFGLHDGPDDKPPSGYIVIAGTGSVVLGRTRDGAMHRVGGWGYLLGDEGSGHALGLAALRRLGRVLDGDVLASPLTRLVQERLALPDAGALIHAVYRGGLQVQKAAPLVCEAATAGDEAAQALLDQQTTLLAGQVGLLARKLDGAAEPRVGLLGGLTKEGAYRACLIPAIEAAVPEPGWTVAPVRHTPAEGALARARRLARRAA